MEADEAQRGEGISDSFQGHVLSVLPQERQEVQLLHQWPTADLQSGGTSQGSFLPGVPPRPPHAGQDGTGRGTLRLSPRPFSEASVTAAGTAGGVCQPSGCDGHCQCLP